MRLVTSLTLIMLVALLAQAATADNYQIAFTPLDNSILPNESASFKLVITNFDRAPHRFQIYTLNTEWVLRIDPLLTSVGALSVSEHEVRLRPKAAVGFGTEGVTVIVKELDDRILDHSQLLINVENPERTPGEWPASVELDVSIPKEIDPREPFSIELEMQNRNYRDLTGLVINVESPLFDRSFEAPLGAVEERSEELTFALDRYQAAGDYLLRVQAVYGGKVINDVSKTLRIVEITDVAETQSGGSELFRHTRTVELENRGNAQVAHETRLETSWLRSVFSSTQPHAETVKEDGARYHVWLTPLSPGETATIERVENYRLLAVILILAVVAAISYFLLRSPLIAVKEAIALREKGDEGSSSIKVRIFVKNRTGRQLAGVNVIDRVPALATYKPHEHLGSVSPTKVVTSEKGTMLKWELDILEPYEERILSYSLASQLKILGRMRLPPAKVRFGTKGGAERVTFTKNAVYEE